MGYEWHLIHPFLWPCWIFAAAALFLAETRTKGALGVHLLLVAWYWQIGLSLYGIRQMRWPKPSG